MKTLFKTKQDFLLLAAVITLPVIVVSIVVDFATTVETVKTFILI